MKSTKFWVILLAIVLVLSVGMALYISLRSSDGVTANIYFGGERLYSIDLSKVTSAYTIEITGNVQNTIAVEEGRICVISATCPDQICVHQGWISNGVVPVVCLPNQLVIQIESLPIGAIDAVSR